MKLLFDTYCYSGAAWNSVPDWHKINEGPTPYGLWHMAPGQKQNDTGPISISITPLPGNWIGLTARDYDSFRIHGASIQRGRRFGDASHGCPICDPDARNKITDEWGGILNVVRD